MRCALRLALLTATALTCLGLGGSLPATAQEGPTPLAPTATLRKLERLTSGLARKGQRTVVEGLLEVLTALEHDERAVTKARKAADRILAKAKGEKSAPKEANTLRALTADLAAHLPALDAKRRPRLATEILRLDDDVEAAHQTLGHQQVAGEWVPEHVAAAFQQRGLIREAIQRARQLPVEIKSGESRMKVLETVHGRKGRFVRWGRITLHSVALSEVRLRRMLENAVRASAVSNFVRTGKLTPPPLRKGREIVLLVSKTDYLAAVDDAAKNGGLAEELVKPAREDWSVYPDNRGYTVVQAFFETAFQAVITRIVFWSQLSIVTGYGREEYQVPLHKGHLNWLCYTFVGAPVPSWVVYAAKDANKSGRTAERADHLRKREMYLKLAKTGLAGIRSYMRYLAERGEDPAFVKTIYADPGELAGEELLKATLVVEYLQETDRFWEVFRTTRNKPHEAATFEAALNETLASFDANWREWLLAGGSTTSLVERLEQGAVDTSRPDALVRLDAIRKQVLPDADRAGLDAGLSTGCRLHALYLVKHTDQQSSWPECHEEFTDRELFTPQGAFAGSSSVIAPGSTDGPSAVDGWLGTFYHRLSLLDPGLLRVGWAMEGGVAVLDVGSMVSPSEEDPIVIAWPPSGAKSVPLRFNPEMPNPVPGVDQTTLGYPVTLQFFGEFENPPDVTLELFAGSSATGAPLPAYVSTPSTPTNPITAPKRAFCLMPKSNLRGSATYTVRASGMPDGKTKTWSFRTAAK